MLLQIVNKDQERPWLQNKDFNMVDKTPGWVRVSPYDYESQQLLQGIWVQYIEEIWIQFSEMASVLLAAYGFYC